MYGTKNICADFREGRISINGVSYPAGTFAVHLLNQFYKDDTAARLSVFKNHGRMVLDQLRLGYLKENDFLETGREIHEILNTLPKLSPFQTWDIAKEREWISSLFTETIARQITAFFVLRAEITNRDAGQVYFDIFPKTYHADTFKEMENVIQTVNTTISFYHSISEDMQKTFYGIRKFVDRADEADCLSEEHLFPIAREKIKPMPFPVKTEFVSCRYKGKMNVVAIRLHFDSYYSFVITDFFEGLHYGHYPRRCQVCKNYFLMTSARRQLYCDGFSPFEEKGIRLSCRQYAAQQKRKEKAEADPVADLYKRRQGAIRSDQSRGTITAEFAEAAKEMTREYKWMAYEDPVYAKGQYQIDMEKENIYAVVRQRQS